MSDVFVSYARSSETQARQVAGALNEQGYSVWSDDELPAHRAYGDVIEERLKAARAVVVLWSSEAAKSQWVRAEADAARQAGTLVQATLDGTIPPLPFNQIQCADLRGWTGGARSPGWDKLAASVAALTGPAAQPGEQHRHWARRDRVSVCVLPFANMSGDPEQEYFSDGISEDITTDLSNVSALEVIARNTAFQFKGQAVDVCEVARKLGVSHVLEGSVRKSGNRVRITAQLIDGQSGGHLWAERYDRDLTDIFAIQDEISKAIVAALKLKLLPEEKKAIEQRGTTSAEAYNLYLMARDYWATGNHGDVGREQRVIRLCERAVEIDPNYARAWALLAIAQSSLRYGFGIPGEDGAAAAAKALSIDPGVVEAYCPIARRHTEQRKFTEAEIEIAAGLRIDPKSWELHKEGARLHSRQRHFREAAHHLEHEVATEDTDYYAWGMLIGCYHALGDSAAVRRVAEIALGKAEEALSHDPGSGAALSVAARALAALGESKRAREWIERGLLVDPGNLNMRYNFASVFAAHLGEPEAALALLESTMPKASGALIRWAEIDPDVDSIRSEPRFRSLLDQAKARAATPAETLGPQKA
ncbi:MAG TPA: TIR domain-containing protein [Sphingomicrobium sp.]|nr:TIR domain-containing protein [Sphingomicrobium sp.]